MNHDRILTAIQWVAGLYFVGVGLSHFILPDGLPAMMSWMYELETSLHRVSGAAEVLGGLGLILPGLTKIQPRLTVVAAVGLILVMIGAAIWHFGREEFVSIGSNVLNILVLSYIAYGRSRLSPYANQAAG